MRNMVYARRGRPFRSEILRAYFARLDWYKADPAYTDARLTDVDQRGDQGRRTAH
ncbi:MAG: YARHG domain-containing protein [Pseudomonadota bacterium]